MATLSIKPISEIRQALAQLADQPRDGKVTSMLRAVSLLADDVRALLKNGYTYAEIADILSDQGVPISAPTLRSYMSRITIAKRDQARHPPRPLAGPVPSTAANKSSLDSAQQAHSTGQQPGTSSATFRPTPDSESI